MLYVIRNWKYFGKLSKQVDRRILFNKDEIEGYMKKIDIIVYNRFTNLPFYLHKIHYAYILYTKDTKLSSA